jgi:hypothetical protein
MLYLKKIILSFTFGIMPIASALAYPNVATAETIRTKNFEIKITRHCEEGNISCDRVTYVGKSLRTGKSISLTGKTLNRSQSYTFLGYEFRNGIYTYFISNHNVLMIYKGGRVILREEGTSIDD